MLTAAVAAVAAVDDAVSAIFPCYFRCFLLPVLPRAVVASAACTCKCQKIIHTHRWQQQMEITHTVRVPAKQTYCAPFTIVCCCCCCCCFCPFVRPFVCRFVRLVLFALSLSLSRKSKCCEFLLIYFCSRSSRILFAFFHRTTHACVCMYICNCVKLMSRVCFLVSLIFKHYFFILFLWLLLVRAHVSSSFLIVNDNWRRHRWCRCAFH